MKKILLSILGIIIVISGIILLITLTTEENVLINKLNPFLKKTDVYVEITESGTKREIGDYEYTLIGFDENGKERKVTFTASKNLRKGAYLKLVTKRPYVESWVEVEYEDIPEDIKAKKK